MKDYRLYCLDGTRRIMHPADVIKADSDEQAVAQAKALALPVECELWQGRRLVATIPPGGSTR